MKRLPLAAQRSLAALVILAGIAYAYAEEAGPYGMKVGPGSRLLLTLDVGSIYRSNWYYQEDDEESAIGLQVRPTATLMVDKGAARFQFQAGAELGGFNLPGDKDDYVDTGLGGLFEWNPVNRHKLSGGAGWRHGHDPFGTRRSEVLGTAGVSLDEWDETSAGLVYRFGAPTAKINLEGGVQVFDREYDTNRAFTQFLDYDATTLRGTVFYNVSSKTSLLAEITQTDIDYDTVAPGFDSRSGEIERYRVGARWAATGKTVGDVRIGRVERTFDDPDPADFDELDWEAKVTWSPRARDEISFSTGRSPEESYILASNLIDHRFYLATWSHDWTAALRSIAAYRVSDQEFVGTLREDDVQRLSAGIEYKPARHWAVLGELSHEERDSNAAFRSYDDTALTLGIRLMY